MTFAAINWLSISIDLLLVIFVIVCFLMTLLILMQRPKQEGLGAAFGGGVTDQVFGARTTNVLQRGTVYLGSMFFILSLALAILIGQKNKTVKTVTKEDLVPTVEVPIEVKPKSLSEELSIEETTPTETPAPVPTDVPADAPKVEAPPAAVTPPVPVPAEPTPAEPAPAEPTAPVEPAPADGTAAPEDKPKEP